MGTFEAIGGVSATLRTLLRDRMELPGGVSLNSLRVSISTPQAESEDSDREPRVNLFLYRVSEHAALKNQEIPGRGAGGGYGRPPLSLELHYLLTTYGSTSTIDEEIGDETLGHFLLGSAMRVLHDTPVVGERLVTTRVVPLGQPILHASLVAEFEQVKLTLDPLSLEDITKVWTALTRPYRLSAAYRVSVVQIESQLARRFPQPVGEPPPAGPRLYPVPLRRPQIREVNTRRPGDPPGQLRPLPHARLGDTLVLLGQSLAAPALRLVVEGFDASASVLLARADRVDALVPDAPALQPGVLRVYLVHEVLMGEPPVAHGGFQSNLGVFMLVPRIDSQTANLGANPRTLRLDGARLFHPERENLTLVGDTLIPATEYVAAASGSITMNLPATLGSGEYPVRVRVNGAESIDDVSLTIP
jgi:hypothetical protein